MNYEQTLKDLKLKNITTGWGYMRRAVDDDEGKDFGSGFMTNGVVVFDQSFRCKYYKKREI